MAEENFENEVNGFDSEHSGEELVVAADSAAEIASVDEVASVGEVAVASELEDEIVETEQAGADVASEASVVVLDLDPEQPANEDQPAVAEAADKADDSAPIEEPAKPEVPAAVSLGLLPEVFVSQVSTSLHFYAPEITLLPALPGSERDEDDSAGNVRRRNRRRERNNEESGGDSGSEQSAEPQRIKGSTRLEAKKQRRREGRDSSRRRTVVTEAEFMARREAVDREMVVRTKNDRTQIAVLEDKVVVEHYVARSEEASLIGNVYLGRVQNVLPSMEAAFVDIGRGRNAVLYSGEVDWDSVETGNQPRRIELALKPGDQVLVQVTKDPIGHKGARLTSQISLPGRYLVYVPGGAMNGISRKLPDTERVRLKKILKEVVPESSGVIVRTAAEGASEEQLTRDVRHLSAQWEHISNAVKTAQAPALLHAEPDLLVKIVRDVFNEDFTKMVVQGSDSLEIIRNYVASVAPDLLDRIQPFEGDEDPFDTYRVNEQIEKALERKAWLPSGGSLVIDRTEAMTVIDVNTGKFVGSGGNLEETVTKNNLEAAEEIVRQLRLRDIGGIIVIDFIDMVLESNRDLVLRRLIECLSRDRTKHQVAEVTSLGLVQMTRKRIGLGLLETFSEACETCAGRGVVVHHEPVFKHRSSSSNNSQRRGNSRQSAVAQSAPASTASQSGSTHVLTEGMKSALAQIAASTIAPDAAEEPVADEPKARKRRKRASDSANAKRGGNDNRRARSEKSDVVESAGVGTVTERSDSGSARTAPVLVPDKAKLLDEVLNSLPEPKAPGQGRGRRRVTTGALTAKPSGDGGA